MTLKQLRWRPQPRAWSIGECLDHLNIALALYLPRVEHVLALANSPEAAAFRLVEPAVRISRVGPAETIPPVATDPDRLVDLFPRLRDRYIGAVRRAVDADVAELRLPEPVCPAVRSLGGTLLYLAAHDRRHIRQAEQVRRKPGFP